MYLRIYKKKSVTLLLFQNVKVYQKSSAPKKLFPNAKKFLKKSVKLNTRKNVEMNQNRYQFKKKLQNVFGLISGNFKILHAVKNINFLL